MSIRSVFFFTCLFAVFLSPLSLQAYEESSLMLEGRYYQIPAVLTLPSGEYPAPGVVMLHGTGADKNEVGGLYTKLAVALAEQGIASLRIDFAGTGDSPVGYRRYNLSTAVTDAQTALSYMMRQKGIDKHRLGLVGFSQGGLIAQLLAENDDRVKAMVLWSSVGGDGQGSFARLFDKHYPEAQKRGYSDVSFRWRPPLAFDRIWFEEVEANTSLSDLKDYHGALLAIAGADDQAVPYETSERIINAAGSFESRLEIIRGANHIFNVLGPDADPSRSEILLKTTSEWLAEVLDSAS